jgi:hypothetical protein
MEYQLPAHMTRSVHYVSSRIPPKECALCHTTHPGSRYWTSARGKFSTMVEVCDTCIKLVRTWDGLRLNNLIENG